MFEPAAQADGPLRGPRYLAAVEAARLGVDASDPVLAVVSMGQPSDRTGSWLAARVPCRPLQNGLAEVWPASGTVLRFDIDRGRAAGDGASLFVSLEAADPDLAGIDRLAYDVYRSLFRELERAGYPHILRMWNFVPTIHGRSAGFDRYQLFCKGRSDAFASHYGDLSPSHLPAASAVGCSGETLVVHALASRLPGRRVENPRQVSAYRYPVRYGPKSPTFSRATAAPPSAGGALFVSGTASIVGFESVHPGDPARQTRETMTNIASVLDAAGVPGAGGPLGARLESLRVYVRRACDLETIQSVVAQAAGGGVPAVWLQAEICRDDLLVEVEAIARLEDSAYGV